MLRLGAGDVQGAVDVLERPILGVLRPVIDIPGFAPAFVLAEAYARAGRPEEADALLSELHGLETSTLPLAAGTAARCRGLIAADDEFEGWFDVAIAAHTSIAAPFELARSRFCFGERLRRSGSRIRAREELRQALATFEALGSSSWAERARSELRITGETLRRDAVAGEELTPQELQIALQVVEGKTNREVAAALFLSPKTVEFHLGRVYRKLSIRSRRELQGILATSSSATG